MPTLNVKNRTLFIGDNLGFLRNINSESVDLIATDPPFNKNVKAFKGRVKAGEDKKGKEVSYKDVWTWDKDVQSEWIEMLRSDHPALHSVVQAAQAAAGDDMGAYLCWLGVRVLEMRRILKPTGSLYLQCDHTAGAWIKTMMDAVFGRANFRNEIIWCYHAGGASKRHFPRKHDTLLLYGRDATRSKHNILRVERYRDIYAYDDAGEVKPGYHPDGKMLHDWWEIPQISSVAKERKGYPTQKPIALYKRIVEASSDEGDVVLDPFAGCATTCVAAEQTDRKWIGIDILDDAKDVMFDRLRDEVTKRMNWNKNVTVAKRRPVRSDDGKPAAPELRVASRQRNAPRLPAREIRKRLISMQSVMRCDGCGWTPHREDYLQVDHVMPKSKGGKDVMENYTLLCGPCNQRKSHKLTLAELRKANDRDGHIQDEEWATMAGWR